MPAAMSAQTILAASGLGHRCPTCGAPLERVHRHRVDRWLSHFRTVHRYRCTGSACGWEGRQHSLSAPRASASAVWRLRLLWFLLGAAAVLAAVQGVRLVQQQGARHPSQVPPGSAERQSQAAPPGQSFDGEALPVHDERVLGNRTPLALRNSCAWGVPGRNPYRGTVEQALHAARLPPEVVRQVAERAERGWVTEQVEIARTGIRSVDQRHDYGPRMLAMAFGNSLCFNTRVNFEPGHVEYAALYRAEDRQGRHYTVIVPYVCQNVAVLGERAEDEPPPGRIVPEPATWALALAALGAGAARTAWRRGGRP
jgi:hypothetical protein